MTTARDSLVASLTELGVSAQGLSECCAVTRRQALTALGVGFGVAVAPRAVRAAGTALRIGVIPSDHYAALYTALAMIRGNHSRIETLREDVISQFMGFARIWASEEHQRRIAEACAPSRDLKPVTFAVVVPVYGTLDLLVEDWRRWRRKRSSGSA